MEDGFSTFEMRASRRGTMKSQRGTMKSTTSRKSTNLAMINSSRAPPRPNPGLVNYSDEDSAKGYDENPDDSDSLTEKPSEISSTDSQVRCYHVQNAGAVQIVFLLYIGILSQFRIVLGSLTSLLNHLLSFKFEVALCVL